MENRAEQKTSDTQIHRQLGRQLAELNLGAREEVEFPPFVVDWYVMSLHAAFEADGDVWHQNNRAQQARDDYLLAKYNLFVVHLNSARVASNWVSSQDYQIARLRASADERFEGARMEISWA